MSIPGRYGYKSKLRLSEHFYVKEFFVSEKRPDLVRKMYVYDPKKDLLFLLVTFILQPVRWAFGKTTILSGYRSPELNSAVEGWDDSDHMRGMAADIFCSEVSMEAVYLWAKTGIIKDRIGQCIWYPQKNFVHISLPTPKHRAEFFEL